MRLDAVLREASLSPSSPLPAPAPIPGTVIVQRRDRRRPETVLESEIRWARPVRGNETVAWWMTQTEEAEGLARFVRMAPDARFGVRVDLIGGVA